MPTWATNIVLTSLPGWNNILVKDRKTDHIINILARSHRNNPEKKMSHLNWMRMFVGSMWSVAWPLASWPLASSACWSVLEQDAASPDRCISWMFCDTIRSGFDVRQISLMHDHNYFYGSLLKSACVTWGSWCRECFQWELNQRHLEILGLMHYRWIEISLDELFSISDTLRKQIFIFSQLKLHFLQQKSAMCSNKYHFYM